MKKIGFIRVQCVLVIAKMHQQMFAEIVQLCEGFFTGQGIQKLMFIKATNGFDPSSVNAVLKCRKLF